MKHVDRSEILPLGEYEQIRDRFRSRVILEKKARRVALGANLTVLFENHDTVLLQVQEMLRTERITREGAVQHEIDTYNELLGGPGELGATAMIGIADPVERNAFLVQAKGIERHFVLQVGDEAIRAAWDESRVLPEQASAVMYLRFPLTDAARAAFAKKDVPVTLVVDHPAASERVLLPRATAASLAEDVSA